MRIAMLCSGLGNVLRGHEVFASSVFDALRDELDITLYKGGGNPGKREVVVPHIPRYAPVLDNIHLVGPKKWRISEEEGRRQEIEFETFAYAALKSLLNGGYDIIHCAENTVSNIIYENRLLFANVPKIVYHNGGALLRRKLPACDFVQELTRFNLKRSATAKSVYIPHGVDLRKFDPQVASTFRAEHNIPKDALVVLTVGNISRVHKRMDYVIREVAQIENAYLVIVGQQVVDSKAVIEEGNKIMPGRILFTQIPNDELPAVYKAADIFTLGSQHETFGIVYIEAMAMELPVIATNHENQRQIIQEGVFIDMGRNGELRDAIRNIDEEHRKELGKQGRIVVEAQYDYQILKKQYVDFYRRINAAESSIPVYTLADKIKNNIRNSIDQILDKLC